MPAYLLVLNECYCCRGCLLAAAGLVLAAVLNKVMAVIKGGPQKMQEYAMQQMMQQMMKQMGSAPPGGWACGR